MLIEIGMFDAYGAGFEFQDKEIIIKHHNLKKYYSNCQNIKDGCYTDDTQMSIAITELILNHDKWNPYLIAEYFFNAYHRDKRFGYSPNFQYILDSSSDHNHLLELINSTDIVSNGSVMRSVPLSVIKDVPELVEKCRMQSSVTHNSYEAIISSQAVALIGNFFLYQNGNKKDLVNYIFEKTNEFFNSEKTDEVRNDAIDTVDAVISVLIKSNTMLEVLNNAVALGGDTDSVASIAGGLASLSSQYTNDLPSFLFDDLENETYGKDYLKSLDKKIINKFNLKITN
jgi:ADP-ribosyl-[dinitrogen reductase] hydrolase